MIIWYCFGSRNGIDVMVWCSIWIYAVITLLFSPSKVNDSEVEHLFNESLWGAYFFRYTVGVFPFHYQTWTAVGNADPTYPCHHFETALRTLWNFYSHPTNVRRIWNWNLGNLNRLYCKMFDFLTPKVHPRSMAFKSTECSRYGWVLWTLWTLKTVTN